MLEKHNSCIIHGLFNYLVFWVFNFFESTQSRGRPKRLLGQKRTKLHSQVPRILLVKASVKNMMICDETVRYCSRIIKHVKLYKIIVMITTLLLLVPLGAHYYLNNVNALLNK